MIEKVDIVSFFSNTDTVWVSENFQNIFLDNYQYVEINQESHPMHSSDLQDMQVQIDPQALVFFETDMFLVKLAGMIQSQIYGDEGALLNDSSANYFFVQSKDGNYYSVLIRWEQAQKKWRCGAYLQEELKMPNIRIFYPVSEGADPNLPLLTT